jgi:outer membrane protein OmpA-like peptidoglycan-associated protein
MFAAASLGLLSACVQPNDPAWSAFNTEAGKGVTDGGFGNATMNNTLVMTGQAAYRDNLATRFAASVPSTITFAFNSATLDAEAQANLRQQADFMRQFPEVRFSVYGHTDLVGSTAGNYQLGLRRAQAAVSFLASLGIDRSRLDALVSEGKTQPVVMTQGPERRNRRTVTTVSGFVERHPNVLNGRYAEIIFRDFVTSAEPASTLTPATAGNEAGGGGGGGGSVGGGGG